MDQIWLMTNHYPLNLVECHANEYDYEIVMKIDGDQPMSIYLEGVNKLCVEVPTCMQCAITFENA